MDAQPRDGAPTSEARLKYPRAFRVVLSRDFQRAWSRGSRARGDCMIVVAVPNGLAHARLGLSVGKVIWKSAVKRNRVRRVFREAFRTGQRELPAGFDLVLIPAQPRLEPTLAVARAELIALARKAAARAVERAAREPPEDPEAARAVRRLARKKKRAAAAAKAARKQP